VENTVSRLSWERKTVKKLFQKSGRKVGPGALGPQVRKGVQGDAGEVLDTEESLCLRIVPEGVWRQGEAVSECIAPIPCVKRFPTPSDDPSRSPANSLSSSQNKPKLLESTSLAVTVSGAEDEYESAHMTMKKIQSSHDTHLLNDSAISHTKVRNTDFEAYVLLLKRMEHACGFEVFRSSCPQNPQDRYTGSDLESNICNTESVTSPELRGHSRDEFNGVHGDGERVFLVASIPRSAGIAVAEITFRTSVRPIDGDQGTGTGMEVGTGTETGAGAGSGTGAAADVPGSFARVSPSEVVSSTGEDMDQSNGPHSDADPRVHIVVRVMSIADVLNACLPLSGSGRGRDEKTALRQAGYDFLTSTIRSVADNAGCDPPDLRDHSVVENLQKNILFCILSLFERTVFSDSLFMPSYKINQEESSDVEGSSSGVRDISMIKTLCVLLGDAILVDEKHVSVIEDIDDSLQLLTHSKSTDKDERDKREDKDKDVNRRVDVRRNEHSEVPFVAKEQQSLVPSTSSVLRMIAAMGSASSVGVINDTSSSLILCVPFDCSLSSSTLTSAMVGTSNITSYGKEIDDTVRDVESVHAVNLNSVSDLDGVRKEEQEQRRRQGQGHRQVQRKEGQGQGQGQEQEQGQGQGHVAGTFAMGFSLVHADGNTPHGCVTVLTVAYHSDEITRAYSTCSTTNKLLSNDSARIKIEPMHIVVSDTRSTVCSASNEEDSIQSHTGGLTEESMNVKVFDNLVESVKSEEPRVKLDVTASDKNKAEGGLFGFVVEEMSFKLSGMFFHARQQVLLSQAWNVLQSDYLLPRNTSIETSHGTFSDTSGTFSDSSRNTVIRGMRRTSEEEGSASAYPLQETAWVQSSAVKEMQQLLIRESTAVPLSFLGFLQYPLLLIAQALAHVECPEGLDSFPKGQHTTSSPIPSNQRHDTDRTEESSGSVLLRRLVHNLSLAFDNRCRCFIEENDRTSVTQQVSIDSPAVMGVGAEAGGGGGTRTGTGIGTGTELGTGIGSEIEAEKKTQSGLKASRVQSSGRGSGGSEQDSLTRSITKDRNCTLHILVSLPASPSETLNGATHCAIHVCIPSVTSTASSTAPSTPSIKKRKESATDTSKKGKKSPVLRDVKNDAGAFEKTITRKSVKPPFVELLESVSEVGLMKESPESEKKAEEERVQAFISVFVNVILYTVSSGL
jgi:hypothetical protein